MRPFDLGTAALAVLSLSWSARAYQNSSSVNMMRAQLALMDDRPDECPPWYDTLSHPVLT
jgi:hypothetical protein